MEAALLALATYCTRSMAMRAISIKTHAMRRIAEHRRDADSDDESDESGDESDSDVDSDSDYDSTLVDPCFYMPAQRAVLSGLGDDASMLRNLPMNLLQSAEFGTFEHKAITSNDGRCHCCGYDRQPRLLCTMSNGDPYYSDSCKCSTLGRAHIRFEKLEFSARGGTPVVYSAQHLDGFLLARAFTNYTPCGGEDRRHPNRLPRNMFYQAATEHTDEHVCFVLDYFQYVYVLKMTFVPRSTWSGPTLRFEIVGVYSLSALYSLSLSDRDRVLGHVQFGHMDSVWFASVGVALLKHFRAREYAALPADFRAKLDTIPSMRQLVATHQHKCPCCGDTAQKCPCSIDGMLIAMISCVVFDGDDFELNGRTCTWFVNSGDDGGVAYGETTVVSGVNWTGRAQMSMLTGYRRPENSSRND